MENLEVTISSIKPPVITAAPVVDDVDATPPRTDSTFAETELEKKPFAKQVAG